jgi:hypothetical protein
MSSKFGQPSDEESSDLLRSLVAAMRRVVESTRDRTLAEMRKAVESKAGQLEVTRSARETALRERAEAEITGIGSWERAEIERLRAEALRKVQARGGLLDQELAELAGSSTAEHADLAARADAYEREVKAFIEGLEGIHDPAAFAAAARRMPSPWTPPGDLPQLAVPATSAAVTTGKGQPAESEPSRPAEAQTLPARPVATAPGQHEGAAADAVAAPAAGTSAAERPGKAPLKDATGATAAVATAPAAAAPAAAAPAAEAPAAEVAAAEAPAQAVADQATSIQVHGLGSFGAITSFKQSLERVEGIRSVTLSLSPTGEFVYTATHAAALDLGEAIRAIEGEGVEIQRDNDTVRVRVGTAAKAR